MNPPIFGWAQGRKLTACETTLFGSIDKGLSGLCSWSPWALWPTDLAHGWWKGKVKQGMAFSDGWDLHTET